MLGKKSWNVYNQDNIEKVKRDEAAAKAREEAREEQMQEADAERRMQILRGEIPTPLSIEDKAEDDDGRENRSYRAGRERKRRKKAGENDTDFEMRVAQEQTPKDSTTEKQIVLRKSDAPVVDRAGHIDLFPQDPSRKPVEKNPEVEKEVAKKKKEYEDQYTMRFSNAAGFKQGLENPWYSKPTAAPQAVEGETHSKDVWGNEDPRRKEREAARIVSNDPLAFMKQGAAQVRQVEKERKRWREEKEKEMRELEEAERRRQRRKRRWEADDGDKLEDFRLDDSEKGPTRRGHDGHDRERRHHRHKESRHRPHRDDEGRHRHRSRHRHRD